MASDRCYHYRIVKEFSIVNQVWREIVLFIGGNSNCLSA